MAPPSAPPTNPESLTARSTPRRFGKTFSIAIFCACFLLTQKAEIVVFSPARRASRKLLERVIEFVNILGHKPIEFNQEQARMKCYNGEESLIRSFPCAAIAIRAPRSLF